mgnify:CR=1 FL=1
MPLNVGFKLDFKHQFWRVMIIGGILMYAIIATGGKQYKVSEGDVLFVEKLEANEGDVVRFQKEISLE